MFAAVVAGSVPIIAQLTSAMPKLAPKQKKGPTLAQAKEINAFLASVERRAFKHAAYAVRDDDTALDIVQDSMMKLTESYADKPAAELPMLFTRILQNTILDYFRRTKTRNQYVTNFSSLGGAEADDDFDVDDDDETRQMRELMLIGRLLLDDIDAISARLGDVRDQAVKARG